WADCARQSQNRRASFLNPAVAYLPCVGWRRRNAPVRRQLSYRKNFREAVPPLQMERFVFFIWRKRFVVNEDFEGGGRLMFTNVNDAHVPRIPAPAVTP